MNTQSNVEALLERWRKKSDRLTARHYYDFHMRALDIDECITELESALKADREAVGR